MIGYVSTLRAIKTRKVGRNTAQQCESPGRAEREEASAEETERPWPSPSLLTALRTCTSPGHHSNANHAGGGTGELAVRS